MAILKIAVFIFGMHYALTSHSSYSHTIPIEGYETKLQVLGQHVEIPEPPVKVIKITKTVAVKIPVPYPVKVKEKVPYPVHFAKPYPVPVPQIIKVPHIVTVHQKSSSNDGGWSGVKDHGSSSAQSPISYYSQQGISQPGDVHEGNGIGRAYEVQEESHSYLPTPGGQTSSYDSGIGQSYGHDGGDSGASYGSGQDSYGYGSTGGGSASFAPDAAAINEYYKSHGSGSNDLGTQHMSNIELSRDNSHYH